MITINQGVGNNYSQLSNKKSQSSENTYDFNYKIDDLNDSLSEEYNSGNELLTTTLINLRPLHIYKGVLNTEQETVFNTGMSSLYNEQICSNFHSDSLCVHSNNKSYTVNTIQELSSFIDKHLLNNSSNISDRSNWIVYYVDSNGVKLDFHIKKTQNDTFSLTCNLDINNVLNHIHGLSERLIKKGWAIQTDTQPNNHTLYKITNRQQ
ncbi:hypothetical protein [Candidatus Thiodiazotropha endoloripes]|uniref:hypothetical protein n=1 Tax=Candidatus Thiodiazotropha endoloripes TaxID=1818881 RepID=UPI001111C02B|nr:hypothetical protein [Candidatus Thiodiazotropha endoloripes]